MTRPDTAATLPDLAVSLGYWQDRPPAEALLTAQAADSLGYRRLWVGEMATYDVMALATRIGALCPHIDLVLGPLAVAVRDPMLVGRGVASVAALTERRVDVALGTSSPLVVSDWHGRARKQTAATLRESVQALRGVLSGAKTTFDGNTVSTRNYRLRLDAPTSTIAVAAFGSQAVAVAGQLSDRMVLNMLTPASAATIIEQMHIAAGAAGRTPPPVTAWVPAAAVADDTAIDQIRRGLVGYLAAPGYDEMFRQAGFGELVTFARTRPHPRALLAAMPREIVETVGLVGDSDQIRRQLVAYAAAGVDEVAIVPASVDSDVAGRTTLATIGALVQTAGVC
jgi:probable F420-dependent oxidoreductase